MTIEQVGQHVDTLMGTEMLPTEMPMDNTMMTPPSSASSPMDMMLQPSTNNGSSFDSVDQQPTTSEDCSSPDLSPLQKLDMQKSGTCPVTRYYNRSFR